MVAALTLTGGLLYGALIAEFGATVAYLNVGTAVGLLLIGISNLFWSPLVSPQRLSQLDTNSGPDISCS